MKLSFDPSIYFFACLCKTWQTHCRLALQAVQRGKDLATTISLCAVVDTMEKQNDQCTSFLDPGKGEIFLLRLEESRMIEEGYDEQSLPEWQLDLLDQTREVLENRGCLRCLRLPSCFEVDEWRIMEGSPTCSGTTPFG
jgi:hypothetical protein